MILQNLFNRISTGKSKRPHDLDRMIERNIDILRAKKRTDWSIVTASDREHSSKKCHRNAYQNLLLKGGDQGSTKKMLELFDHLQWGDGKLYANLQQRMLQRWCIRCETQDVGQSLKWIVVHDLLLKLNPKVLPNFDESLNF